MVVGPTQLAEVTQFLEPIRAGVRPQPEPGPAGGGSQGAGGASAPPNDSAGATGAGAPAGGLDEVAELARSGQTLEAVKRYRAVTGASFSEAQAYIATL